MAPSLREGARVLACSLGKNHVGDIIVFHDPGNNTRISIKRIVDITPEGYIVEGDNLAQSSDSRIYGPVPAKAVVGKILFQYAPQFRWFL